MEVIFSVGDILIDEANQKKYRIVSISETNITLCEMDLKSLSLSLLDKEIILNLVINEELIVEKEEPIVFDKNKLPEKAKKKYEIKSKIMQEVVRAFGPTYENLDNGKLKPEIEEILKKYNYQRSTFWRTCAAYFQSGMREYSLVDARYMGVNKGKEYNYEEKPGKRSEYLENTGILIDDEIRSYFDEALKDYKSGRHKTIKSAFERMNALHFTNTVVENGMIKKELKPISERPTFRQFSYYLNKHITEQEKDLIKTSALEQRNNKRLLTSDSLFGVKGPGDMVEIDACEVDVSLVSTEDPTKTVGRPIVYFMVDVYSRIILAMSVAFDNNSIIGLTNLFLNLFDDKQVYCRKYGVSFDNPKLWPSNIIPNNVRVDRGAEFRGKEFDRICDELGIEKTIVSPGSGSLKGVVEQSFHQMHTKQNVHLENHGLIEKRHDSKHHQTATLNIEEYTRMVINFVLTHNQQYFPTYPSTKEMRQQKIKAIPALLWEYGVKNYGAPRPIPEKEQYLYNLMTPIKAKISRKGISYKDLYYIPENDSQLSNQIFKVGTKSISMEARIDQRDVGYIYYLKNNRLMKAPLNKRMAGNASFDGMTWKEYEDYRKIKKQLDAEGKIHNEELSAFTHALNQSLVEEAKKPALPDHKNMRPTREIEKQAISKSNKISKRLEKEKLIEEKETEVIIDTDAKEISSKQIPVDEKKGLNIYSSWEEALDDW